MSNGSEACCALGICCPAASTPQRQALATMIKDALGLEEDYCEQVAAWMLETFDLAPLGTLQALKDAIATMARRHPAQ
jgi:hypothetical protein